MYCRNQLDCTDMKWFFRIFVITIIVVSRSIYFNIRFSSGSPRICRWRGPPYTHSRTFNSAGAYYSTKLFIFPINCFVTRFTYFENMSLNYFSQPTPLEPFTISRIKELLIDVSTRVILNTRPSEIPPFLYPGYIQLNQEYRRTNLVSKKTQYLFIFFILAKLPLNITA